MRTITAAQQGVIDSGNQSDHVRVSIKDSGGTFRDLTSYPGFNALKFVQWSESINDPHAVFDCTLLREMSKLSLSPYQTGSAVNKQFNPSTSFAALIALYREVKIEVAICPVDKQPSSGDWFEVFRGRVDDFDAANGTDIKFGGRALSGRLAQQFIKTEYVYSYAAVAGVAVPLRIWEPQIAVVLNTTYLLPASRGTGDPGNNKFFKCSQSGTTGTTEPTWTTGTNITDGSAKWDYVGAPTTAGNPVEQVMQNILTDHKAASDTAVTLYTPSSPGWGIRQFIQAREFVLDAIRKLAQQIGWDLRFKWRSGTSQFELTFSAPTRSGPSVAFTFAAADFENPTRLAVKISEIRNAWRIVYSDRADLWPDGSAKRKVIEVSDATSIAKYGELWAEIQEDENSQIDTSTEATALVNAALSDCKEPTAELSIPLVRGFPWVEVNDYYTFTANNLHFDTNQSLAVTQWSHSYEAGGKLQSKLEVRGLPTIGSERWIASSEHPLTPHQQLPHQLVHFDGPATQSLVLSSEVGGQSVRTARTVDKNRITNDDAEIHLYTTPGTALSGNTLKTVIRGDGAKTMSDLVPGKTYYTRAVPRYYNHSKIIRGQPSIETSFTAGRAKSGHYDSASTQSHLPLNGNFEHALDDLASFPFDHWNVVTRPTETTEVWGSGGSLFWGTAATTKGNYLELRASATQRGNIVSDPFEVRRGLRAFNLYLSIRRQGSSAVSGKDLIVDICGYSDSALANQIINYSVFLSGSAAGAYPSLNTWYDATINVTNTTGALGTAVNFITIGLRRGTTGDNSFSWEVGDVYTQEADFLAATIDTLAVTSITQPSWIPVSGGVGFNTGWANEGSAGFRNAEYMKDTMGFVHLRGMVKRTSGVDPKIFTLPTGYVPTKFEFHVQQATSAYGDIEIDHTTHATPGAVKLGTGTATYVSLDGITFDTR